MRWLVWGRNEATSTRLVDGLLASVHPIKAYDRNHSKVWLFAPEAGYTEGELGIHGVIREGVEGIEVVYRLIGTTL